MITEIFEFLGAFTVAQCIFSLAKLMIFDKKIEEKESHFINEEEFPVIYPFTDIRIGTPCVKCGLPGRNAEYHEFGRMIEGASGPGLPKVCNKACQAKNISHLHVGCNSCNSTWLMMTADTVPKKEETAIPNVKAKNKDNSKLN